MSNLKNKKIKILIIGYGRSGKRYFNIIKNFNDLNVFVFPSTNIKKKYLGKKFITLQTAKDFKPDITLICTPANSHVKYALIFSKLKSNIILEKPLSISTQNLSKLRKIVSKNKLSFIVAYNLEYLDVIIKFHKLLKNIKFGKMYSIRINVGSHLSIWKNSKNYTQFSTSIKKLSGVILYELSHELFFLHSIFKDIQIDNVFLKKISNLKIDFEDISILRLKCKKNNKVIFVNLIFDYINFLPTRDYEFIFEKGTIKIDLIQNKIKYTYKDNNKIYEYKGKNNIADTYKLLFQSFYISYKKNNILSNFNISEKVINLINKIYRV